jgi:hypothetical protein
MIAPRRLSFAYTAQVNLWAAVLPLLIGVETLRGQKEWFQNQPSRIFHASHPILPGLTHPSWMIPTILRKRLQVYVASNKLIRTYSAKYRVFQCTCHIPFIIALSFNFGISHLAMDSSAMNAWLETHGFFATPATIQAHPQQYWLNMLYPMERTFYAGMLRSNMMCAARSLTYASQSPSSTNSLHHRPSLFRSRRPNRFSRSRARGSSAVRTLPQLGQT